MSTPEESLQIIACRRGTPHADCVGLRWAFAPEHGFPASGFTVLRDDGSQVGVFFLPEVKEFDAFAEEYELRRPRCGPYFQDEMAVESLWQLRPLIQLVDPRTDPALIPDAVRDVARFLGESHTADPELRHKYWGQGTPLMVEEMLGKSTLEPVITEYYRKRALDLILLLSLRFEFAAFFGLGTDDEEYRGGRYYVQMEINGDPVSVATLEEEVPTCMPEPPEWLEATAVPGFVRHPDFEPFSGWAPPVLLAPTDANGNPLPSSALEPRVAAHVSALTWAEPPAEEEGLIGHGAVLYRLWRDGGRLSPTSDIVRPEREPHYVDEHGGPWPPLEGPYTYEIRSVNLLGEESQDAAKASIEHVDSFAPPPPGGQLPDGSAIEISQPGLPVSFKTLLDWDATQDFVAPDAQEFRVAVRWLPVAYTAVRVLAVTEVDGKVADLLVDSLPAGNYSGGMLSVGGRDFPIQSVVMGTTATIRVLRVSDASPSLPNGEGPNALIIGAGLPTALTRVAQVSRALSLPAWTSGVQLGSDFPVLTTDFPRVDVTPLSGSQLTDDKYPYRIYIHLFRATFVGRLIGADSFQLERPADPAAPALALFNAWKALPATEATAALLNSPVIVYPQHEVSVSVQPPAGFETGLLEIHLTASDNKVYVNSPSLPASDPALLNLKGNEGQSSVLNLSVRSTLEPAVPGLPLYGSGPGQPWDVGLRVWARSAADFAESAQFLVKWQPASSAVRYEVWRVLQEGLPGASASTSDGDLRALAVSYPDAFQLRSDVEFGIGYWDDLPGRAPTRALYKVRAVSAGGVRGPFSDIIGPVHVPDVRRPAAPNLLRASALRHDPIATPPVPDLAIQLDWTQPGDRSDLRFDLYFRPRSTGEPFALAGSVARGTAPDAFGRYRFTHIGRMRGETYEYQVVAVREAPDPIDPTGVSRRNIAGPASDLRRATALSTLPLLPPTGLNASYNAPDFGLELGWTNAATYTRFVVWRRKPTNYGFAMVDEILNTDGQVSSYWHSFPGSGTWVYQVEAFDLVGRVRSVELEVVIP